MNYIVLFVIALLFELAVRLIPTKVNFSAIDKFKEVALQLHSIVDIIIPNVIKDK
jgi:hypothetical protein